MEQLIFIGVLILFSALDAIARKKKAAAEHQMSSKGPTPEEQDWKWEPVGEELSSYDAEPSYDDHVEAAPMATWLPSAPAPTPTPVRETQDLIPKDVWEEIAALAGGRPAPEPVPVLVPKPAEPQYVEPQYLERGPHRPEHRAHDAHARYGTPMSGRLTALDMPEDHESAGPSDEIRSVRGMLSGGGMALREAVILQELLGPPVSLRED